jgi:serine/threonine protein kinase
MEKMSLVEMISMWLTYVGVGLTLEDQILDFDKTREAMLLAITDVVEAAGRKILGVGSYGIVISNGGGTCTKYTSVPFEVNGEPIGDDNEITNSYLAAGIEMGPYVYSHQVIEEMDDSWFVSITMEELQGQSLYEYMQDGNPWWEWVPEHLQACIKYMHESGLVHTDLHRSNIWVTPDNDLLFIDWGKASSSRESSCPKAQEWDYIISGVIDL